MSAFLLNPVDHVRFWIAWCAWALRGPYRFGDPSLGAGWIRDQNRRLLREKWYAKEPRPEEFGL